MGSLAYPMDTCGAVLSVVSDEHWVWTVKLILETYCPIKKGFVEKLEDIIDNAVKHGKTTRRITFSCEETPERPIFICEDDGVRISPRDKARLFDRLVGENIRFGLFFILECLLRSGMTIAETSTPGKGARFEIAVPKGMYWFAGTGSVLHISGNMEKFPILNVSVHPLCGSSGSIGICRPHRIKIGGAISR